MLFSLNSLDLLECHVQALQSVCCVLITSEYDVMQENYGHAEGWPPSTEEAEAGGLLWL